MRIVDLGIVPYRQAWEMQEQIHAEVVAGGEERILLVEHPPTITFGRRIEPANLVTPTEQLARLGVEIVHSDRGGDVTFHGPGQLVAYPIVRLADHNLSVGGYVRLLQEAVIAALAKLGVHAGRDGSTVGVWVNDAKICAFGVRIRRGATLHGLALNVETDLNYFNLIVPCGLTGRPVTSLKKILGPDAPTMNHAKTIVSESLLIALKGSSKA